MLRYHLLLFLCFCMAVFLQLFFFQVFQLFHFLGNADHYLALFFDFLIDAVQFIPDFLQLFLPR